MSITITILLITLLIIVIMINRLANIKKDNNLKNQFITISVLFCLWIIGLIMQILFSDDNIKPIYFEYFVYLSPTIVPLIFFNISLLFLNEKSNIKKYRWILILPIILLFFLWTNDFHGLFYEKYSVNLNETVYGPILVIYAAYTYILIIISMIIMLYASIKKSGFFSGQTALIILGASAPLITNIFGVLKIVSITVYITPIMFTITSVCFALAIFKFKALNITPIAFRTIINNMSDAFIVISNDGTIVDKNNTFSEMFKNIQNVDEIGNVFDYAKKSKFINYDKLIKSIENARAIGEKITIEYNIEKEDFNKFFEVDIQPIKSKSGNEYIGTLLLLKDITQHKKDIEIIQEKQDIIVKQEQLVSIGELAGGVAHDINTPISAIKTGILMLEEMTGTRTDSEKEILLRMDNCATKIINIVNSMRNQIRNLGGDTNIDFKLSGVVNDIRIITYHELAKNKTTVDINIVDDLSVKGDPTKLGQVLTNLIVNGSQAYGETGGKIEIVVKEADENTAMITIKDYAGGLDEKIKPYIFKNILTTKGTYGTGLGLYLAYSVIKGNFNGDITFESETGVGTTFMIKIPKAGFSIEEVSKEQDTNEQ